MADKKIILNCERKIAYDSPDHINPEGTRKDNSINPLFNRKLFELFGTNKRLNILDLGCAGGGFVKECIDEGHFAIGLEGSDYSKKFRRAEWRTIPESLFTCDITKKFELKNSEGKKILFDVITSWEVLEHIKKKDIEGLVENIKKNLAKDGIWIVSIAEYDSIINGVNLHQTIKPKSWWIKKFSEMGLVNLEKHKKYFNNQFVRGPYQDGTKSFNLVLTLPENKIPKILKISKKRLIWEKWLGSKIYRLLKIFLK